MNKKWKASIFLWLDKLHYGFLRTAAAHTHMRAVEGADPGPDSNLSWWVDSLNSTHQLIHPDLNECNLEECSVSCREWSEIEWVSFGVKSPVIISSMSMTHCCTCILSITESINTSNLTFCDQKLKIFSLNQYKTAFEKLKLANKWLNCFIKDSKCSTDYLHCF